MSNTAAPLTAEERTILDGAAKGANFMGRPTIWIETGLVFRLLATIDALTAERDAWMGRAQADAEVTMYNINRAEAAERERDALREQVYRLRRLSI